jgi:hypothetical protein
MTFFCIEHSGMSCHRKKNQGNRKRSNAAISMLKCLSRIQKPEVALTGPSHMIGIKIAILSWS